MALLDLTLSIIFSELGYHQDTETSTQTAERSISGDQTATSVVSTFSQTSYSIRSEDASSALIYKLQMLESAASGSPISAYMAPTGNSISSSASQNSSAITSIAFQKIYSIFQPIDYSSLAVLSPSTLILVPMLSFSLILDILSRLSAFFFARSFYSLAFSFAYSIILLIFWLMCSIFFSRFPILFCKFSSFLTAAIELRYSSQNGSPSTIKQNMISQKASMPFSSSTSYLYSACCLRCTVFKMRRLTQCSKAKARLPKPMKIPANFEPSFSCCLRLTQPSMGREKVLMSMVNIFWKGNICKDYYLTIKNNRECILSILSRILACVDYVISCMVIMDGLVTYCVNHVLIIIIPASCPCPRPILNSRSRTPRRRRRSPPRSLRTFPSQPRPSSRAPLSAVSRAPLSVPSRYSPPVSGWPPS